VNIEPAEFLQQRLDLWDTNKLRIVTRLGTAASVVAAGRLLLTSGLGAGTIALGILAGLAAEQVANYAVSKDRAKVRVELDKLIAKASLDYVKDVSARLKAGYREITESVKEQQRSWHEAQIQALEALQARGASEQPDWQSILDRAAALKLEMRPMTTAQA
jgi:hypothetical protein